MRTKPTAPPTTSSVRLRLPASWEELSEEQLRHALTVMARATLTPRQLCARLALSWAGVRVHRLTPMGWLCTTRQQPADKAVEFHLQPGQLSTLAEAARWVTDGTRFNVRLAHTASGLTAADPALHGFTLRSFILADRAYQLYLDTRSADHATRLASLLYTGTAPRTFTPAEQLGAVLWFAYVKAQFARRWNYLFKGYASEPSDDTAQPTTHAHARQPFDPQAHQDQADALIRALTQGDITKEATVLDTDVWRAFTELNAKAREAHELNRKAKKR